MSVSAVPSGVVSRTFSRILNFYRSYIQEYRPIPLGIENSRFQIYKAGETEYIPKVGVRVFVTPNAQVVGNVSLGENSSVWYGAKLIANDSLIEIGSLVSVGDNSQITNVAGGSTYIGDSATIGHGAKLTSCTLEPHSSVEIAAEIGEGSVIESFSVVAAGAKVAPYTRVPSGQIWAGTPASYVRDLTEDEKESVRLSSHRWFELGQRNMAATNRTQEQWEEDAAHAEETYYLNAIKEGETRF